jgi:hypothetical protein
MFVVVSYDVADGRRRLRIANTLLNFGCARPSFSAFECRLDPPDLAGLRERLPPFSALPPTAFASAASASPASRSSSSTGEGKITDNPDVLIV